MKYGFILSLLLMSIFNLSGYSQSQRQIRSRKIKSVYTETTEMRKGELVSKKNLTLYNRKGQILESIEYNKDSVKTSWELFSYNHNGDQITFKILYPITGSLKKEIKTEYDHLNRESIKTEFDKDGNVVETITSLYNKMDDKIEEKTSDAKGNIIRISEFTYDNKGMLTSKKTRNGSGNIIYQKTNQYTY